MGWAGPGPVDKSEGFGRPGWPRPVDKSEGLGRAGPAQAQPIEVRGFGVTGPGLAGPPYLANPQMLVWTKDNQERRPAAPIGVSQ